MALKYLERGFRAEQREGVVQDALAHGIEQRSILPVRECRPELFMCWDVLHHTCMRHRDLAFPWYQQEEREE